MLMIGGAVALIVVAICWTSVRDYKRWKASKASTVATQVRNAERKKVQPDFVFGDDAKDMQLQLTKLARDVVYLSHDQASLRSERSFTFFGGQPLGPSHL